MLSINVFVGGCVCSTFEIEVLVPDITKEFTK